VVLEAEPDVVPGALPEPLTLEPDEEPEEPLGVMTDEPPEEPPAAPPELLPPELEPPLVWATAATLKEKTAAATLASKVTRIGKPPSR
jgi:hypothetical protein